MDEARTCCARRLPVRTALQPLTYLAVSAISVTGPGPVGVNPYLQVIAGRVLETAV
jgi:hypothetical protein